MNLSLRRHAAVSLAAAAAALITAVPAHAVAPSFDGPVTYAGATRADELAYADVSGDGVGDLITGAYDSSAGGLRLFTGTGAGTFDPTPGSFAGTLTLDIAVGNLDGDALPDVVSVDGSTLNVRLGKVGGGLEDPTAYAIGSRPQSLTVADLTGDGRDDVALGGDDGAPWPSTPSGRVWVLLNNGTGSLSATPEVLYTGSNRTGSDIVAADVDQDGDRDLAVANGSRQDAGIYRNQGAGVFADEFGDPVDATDITLGTTVRAIQAGGDLTGDGRLDLIVSAGGGVKVLRGDGAGGFTPGDTWFASGDQNRKIEIADLNADGHLDVVTQYYDPGQVVILTGRGDGTFDDYAAIDLGGYLSSVLVADLDADGRKDIAATNYYDQTLTVLLNDTAVPVPPVVTIRTPPLTKATYATGERVVADYACTDDTTGLTCSGPVADGAPIDTSTAATNRRFDVVARDADGLETRVTHFYDVVDRPAPIVAAPAPAPPAPAPAPPAKPAAPPAKPAAAKAVAVLGSSTKKAASGVPSSQPAKGLLSGKPVSLPVRTPVPNVTVIGGFVVAAGGGNVVAAGGGNVVAAGGGNVIAAGGGNVIAAGGGNVIAAGGGNLFGPRAFSSARRKPKMQLIVLGQGRKHFPQPASGRVTVKLTKKGRALLKSRFRRKGRQKVKVTYAVGLTQVGSGLPTVVSTKTITIRE